MFEIDGDRTSLPLSPDRVLALVASLNTPLVVAADMPVEPTRAYICAYREGAERIGFSIYLQRVQSHQGTFYRHEERLLASGRFDETMNEAMAFAESLGFMMDDLGWSALDPKRRRDLIEETPLFHEPRPPAAPADEAMPDADSTSGDGEGEAAGEDLPLPVPPLPVPPPTPRVAPPLPPRAAQPPAAPPATVFVPPPASADARPVSGAIDTPELSDLDVLIETEEPAVEAAPAAPVPLLVAPPPPPVSAASAAPQAGARDLAAAARVVARLLASL